MRKYILLFVFLTFIANAFSQKYYFDVYGVKQGLSNSDVYVVQQDRNGYIWLGTKSGISRFDGNSFENFFSEEGTAPNGMRAIYIDTTGGIWFGHTGGGLTYYKNSLFENRSIDSLNSDITSIVEDSKHRLWIATYGSGVYRIENPYSSESFVIEHYAGAEGLSDRVSAISSTHDFGMLFITDFGVKYYDEESHKFEFIRNIIPEWPEYFPVITIYEDFENKLWVGTYNGGLYKFTQKAKELKVYDHRDGLAKNWVSYLFEDKNHALWVGTWGGGISVIQDDEFKNFNSENGLDANIIRCIYQDYEGNILIGSKNKGLFVYKGDAFINYMKFKDDRPIQINSIYESGKNQIWLGTDNGIWISSAIAQSRNRDLVNVNANTEECLSSNDVKYIIHDRNKNLWFGTWGGGITTYNAANQSYSFNYLLNRYVSDASNGNVTAMCIDQENNLFVGATEGLIYYEIDNNKIDFLTQTSGLAGNDITALYTASNGVVWIGSRNKGITTINDSEIRIVNHDFDFTPTCFTEDGKGNIWVGTEGLGVLLVKDSNVVVRYSAKDGLVSGMVTSLISDNQNNVFIGTPNGLLEYNSKEDRIISYSEKEGFVGIEVRPNAVFKNKRGDIWFGTAAGMTMLTPSNLRFNKIPPRISITRVRVELIDQDLYTPLSLPYTENSVLIDYKAICITNASKVRYKVKLEGADHDWQPVTDQTFANYPSLPPGEYKFQILAMNNSGVWNDSPVSYSFKIRPPFWQTIWFIAIMIILIIAVIILLVKFRERKLLYEKAELEAKVKERTVEVRDKNKLLAKKNKDITDSINYARRIQAAMMPSDKKVQSFLPNSYVYYRPKDIVSGDFYWGVSEGNRSLIAAADCTGHGVPGAFMSMISISALNKIVKENKILDPAAILNELRGDIIEDLTQGKGGASDTKDGLDIALLSIDYDNQIVDYAGAYNSLYIIKDHDIDESDIKLDFKYTIFKNRLVEVKADRMPIGISERMNQTFNTRRINLEEGDMLIISTDGYIDQFGGIKGGKLMSRRFKEILLELPNNNLNYAYKILDDRFLNWRGEYEQIDDVLVIGICF
jgi:ligand-binding sensor domain-containing protein/serine phosphatase RsbU (regulator of sigma subunit)